MNSNRPPVLFWVIGVVSLIWNLMGGASFLREYSYYTDSALRNELPQAMQQMYETAPSWTYVVFAIAVLFGVIGSIGLLLRKRWSILVLAFSLMAVLIQMSYYLLCTDAMSAMGISTVIMPSVIVIFALFIWYYSKRCDANGWLN